MIRSRLNRLFLVVALLVGDGAALFLGAQTATNANPSGAPRRSVVVPPLRIPSPVKSPVNQFRELLALTPEERRQALTNRPPENQKQILAKVREYEALKPDQRELRLQVTELRWHLWPLMHLAPTNRAGRLALVPAEMRPLVESRLQEWDRLPAQLRQELIDNEAAIRYFTELESGTEEQKRGIRDSLSPARREKLEAGVKEWQAMPEAQRKSLLERFNRFFDLTPAEKQKALGSISEPERRQIEKTLRAFDKLTPSQRLQCIRSLQKFTNLSLEERQQFLKNAERWKLMSPTERQTWRDTIAKLQSQPPQAGFFRLPHPPPAAHPAVAATNGN
jgi:hypothetical protein